MARLSRRAVVLPLLGVATAALGQMTAAPHPTATRSSRRCFVAASERSHRRYESGMPPWGAPVRAPADAPVSQSKRVVASVTVGRGLVETPLPGFRGAPIHRCAPLLRCRRYRSAAVPARTSPRARPMSLVL